VEVALTRDLRNDAELLEQLRLNEHIAQRVGLGLELKLHDLAKARRVVLAGVTKGLEGRVCISQSLGTRDSLGVAPRTRATRARTTATARGTVATRSCNTKHIRAKPHAAWRGWCS
jgi:hypothetical protein